ncbi:HEPN/Toprim-associated domain-containing protein [Burkholderia multivorans]
MISLSVGSIDIDWGKNEFFENHAHLFQPGDESENDYHYVKEDGSPIVKVQQCLKRPLRRVVPRLELLGYTLPSCAAKLTAWLGDEDETRPASMTAFRHALTTFQWRECGEYVDFEEAFRAAYAAAPDSNVPPPTKIPNLLPGRDRSTPTLCFVCWETCPNTSICLFAGTLPTCSRGSMWIRRPLRLAHPASDG